MWNDKVENEIVKYLNEIVGHEIKSNQVAVIPLEKVILTSKELTKDYSLSAEWTNYHDIIGKVHSRAIPVSWKERRVFSTGSQDSPPGSLVSEADRLSGSGV